MIIWLFPLLNSRTAAVVIHTFIPYYPTFPRLIEDCPDSFTCLRMSLGVFLTWNEASRFMMIVVQGFQHVLV
ncbi:hypothetical protein AQUCO_04500026v1 [Aquilegia coerulea]|uniref:Secreted protein n=1 Tax=Aquilegia coerulea TaxID=218851 RepID=A0A2G5CLK0_AQUCA|nr:hypothetical protein AQUCO_04500026v1 [Aquilegia coerulea]